MRNYLALWLVNFDYIDPTIPAMGTKWVWGRNEAEMTAIATPIINNIINAGGSVTVITSGRAYLLMDKAQIYALIAAAGLHEIPPGKYQVDDSPRSTWIPSKVDPNVNPGTGSAKDQDHYKGSTSQIGNVFNQTIIDTFNSLRELAAKLVRSRDKNDVRVGNIINFQLDLVAAGKKTFIDALVTLDPYLDSLT